jgi:hypothetical protein
MNRIKNSDEVLTERTQRPQEVIDFLVGRKDQWKEYALRLEGEKKQLEKHLQKARSRVREIEKQKNYWKTIAVLAGSGMVAMVVVMLSFSWAVSSLAPKAVIEAPKTPAGAKHQRTPDHVLSAVRINNRGALGSGTIISKGDRYATVLTVAHLFNGKLGTEFWVYYADGSYTTATLIASDAKRDLALCRVEADTVLARSYIPKEMIKGNVNLSGVGYTLGNGPKYKTLTYNNAYYNKDQKYFWNFSVNSGPNWSGDSGGGVYIENALVGVISMRDDDENSKSRQFSPHVYAVSHTEIVGFLGENEAALVDCGDWSEPLPQRASDKDSAPLWKPDPNIPIHVENDVHKAIRELRADVDSLKGKGMTAMKKTSIKNPLLKKPSEVTETQ